MKNTIAVAAPHHPASECEAPHFVRERLRAGANPYPRAPKMIEFPPFQGTHARSLLPRFIDEVYNTRRPHSKAPLRTERFGSTIARKPSVSRRFLSLSRLRLLYPLVEPALLSLHHLRINPTAMAAKTSEGRLSFIRGTARICDALNSLGSFSNTARQLIRPPPFPGAPRSDRLTEALRCPASAASLASSSRSRRSSDSLARISEAKLFKTWRALL